MSSKDKDYDYVVNLLKKDAESRASAHKSRGVSALKEPVAKRTSRPDTKFLERVMRSQGLASKPEKHESRTLSSREDSRRDRHSTASSYSSRKSFNSSGLSRSNELKSEDHQGRKKHRNYSPAESDRDRTYKTRRHSRSCSSPPFQRRERHRGRSRSPPSSEDH